MMEKTVCLYVFDTMADWETGYLIAELGSGRYFQKGQPRFRVVTMAASPAPVTTMGGVRILPDRTVAAGLPAETAVLILPGGETWADAVHDPVLALAAECLANGTAVGAICGATMGLARAGLLDDRVHTSNGLPYLRWFCPDYTGETNYRNAPAVAGGRLVTATGTAPLEFAAEVLRVLDVFSPQTLEAWYTMNKNGTAEAYFAFEASLAGG
jgi:putative intracellular protease/amidase